MHISRKSAAQIVTEVSRIIHQQVNLMDRDGIIIASTDPERVGGFHQAARLVAAEGLEQLTIEEDGQFEGARKGLNLPILLGDTVVGVIGITGPVEEVAPYGQLVKKMTEILIRESDRTEQQQLDERIRRRFIEDWLFDDAYRHSPELAERGLRFGIDVHLKRRVLVAEVVDIHRVRDSTEGQKQLDRAAKAFRREVERDGRNVFTRTATHMIGLVADGDDNQLRYLAERIGEAVAEAAKLRVQVGVDRRGERLARGYAMARKALASAAREGRPVCFYEEIALDLFLDEIPTAAKQAFLERVFRGVPERDREPTIHMLRRYFECDGSIGRAAESLFIHKNTLQQRLIRLRGLTGYDPRRMTDAALYVLAIAFHDQMEQR